MWRYVCGLCGVAIAIRDYVWTVLPLDAPIQWTCRSCGHHKYRKENSQR